MIFSILLGFLTIRVFGLNVALIKFSEPPPHFVYEQSLKAQYDYDQIIQNHTISMDQQTRSLENWAFHYNLTSKYSAYLKEMSEIQENFEKNVTIFINNLSTINNQLRTIFNNKKLSWNEQKNELQLLFDENEKELKIISEIRQIFNVDDKVQKMLDE